MASGDARLSRSEPPECRNSLWKYRISWRTRRLGNGRASLTLAFLQAPKPPRRSIRVVTSQLASPAPVFGCVCETDSAGPAPSNESNVDNSLIRDGELFCDDHESVFALVRHGMGFEI